MKLTPERLEESREMIRRFLVKHHTDKDDNSLYMRFSEIMQHVEDITWERDTMKRCLEAIQKKEGDKL